MKNQAILTFLAFAIGLVFSAQVFGADSNKNPSPTNFNIGPKSHAQLVQEEKDRNHQEAKEKREQFEKARGYCLKNQPATASNCGGLKECVGNGYCGLEDSLKGIIKKYAPDCDDSSTPQEKNECLKDAKDELKSRDEEIRKAINEGTKSGPCKGSSVEKIAAKFKDNFSSAQSALKDAKGELKEIKDQLNTKNEKIQEEKSRILGQISKTENDLASALENKSNLEADTNDRVTAMKHELEDQKTLIQGLMDQQHDIELKYNRTVQEIDQKCVTKGLEESKLQDALLKQQKATGKNKLQSASDVLSSASQGGIEGAKQKVFKLTVAECMTSFETRNAKTNAASLKKIELNRLSLQLKQAVAKAARIQTDLNNFVKRMQAKGQFLDKRSQMLRAQTEQARNLNSETMQMYQKQTTDLKRRLDEKEAEMAEIAIKQSEAEVVKEALPASTGSDDSETDKEGRAAAMALAGAVGTNYEGDNPELAKVYADINGFGQGSGCANPSSQNRPSGATDKGGACPQGWGMCGPR